MPPALCVCGGGVARVVSTAWRHVLRNSLTNWRVWRRRPVWKMLSLVFVRVSRVRVAVRVNFRPSFAPIYVKRRLEHLVSFGSGLWAINLVLTSTWRPQIFASSWSCLKDSVSFNISLTNWR